MLAWLFPPCQCVPYWLSWLFLFSAGTAPTSSSQHELFLPIPLPFSDKTSETPRRPSLHNGATSLTTQLPPHVSSSNIFLPFGQLAVIAVYRLAKHAASHLSTLLSLLALSLFSFGHQISTCAPAFEPTDRISCLFTIAAKDHWLQ